MLCNMVRPQVVRNFCLRIDFEFYKRSKKLICTPDKFSDRSAISLRSINDQSRGGGNTPLTRKRGIESYRKRARARARQREREACAESATSPICRCNISVHPHRTWHARPMYRGSARASERHVPRMTMTSVSDSLIRVISARVIIRAG